MSGSCCGKVPSLGGGEESCGGMVAPCVVMYCPCKLHWLDSGEAQPFLQSLPFALVRDEWSLWQ